MVTKVKGRPYFLSSAFDCLFARHLNLFLSLVVKTRYITAADLLSHIRKGSFYIPFNFKFSMYYSVVSSDTVIVYYIVCLIHS